jgi:hypothetical protein
MVASPSCTGQGRKAQAPELCVCETIYRFRIIAFWVTTTYSLICGYESFRETLSSSSLLLDNRGNMFLRTEDEENMCLPIEDGGSMFFRNEDGGNMFFRNEDGGSMLFRKEDEGSMFPPVKTEEVCSS